MNIGSEFMCFVMRIVIIPGVCVGGSERVRMSVWLSAAEIALIFTRSYCRAAVYLRRAAVFQVLYHWQVCSLSSQRNICQPNEM